VEARSILALNASERSMENPETIAEQLFGEALDLPREQRAAFLDGACRGTPEIRRKVDSLLAENDRLSGFLSDSPLALPADNGGPGVRVSPVSAGARLGRYSIVESLGAGGMGVVYRALDQRLERTVAIKILSPGVLTGPEARYRFRREALALAKVNHPHIATVYDVGEQDGIDYIVMECVPGQSLAAKLSAGPLPAREATAIALQVAQALEEAHEQGVIHRDLKPANVMITPKGQAKVLDFGLAKLLTPTDAETTQHLIETCGPAGTPLYMSPEQITGANLDARADLWSLGVLYYEMLTGQTPFRKSSSLAILRAITEEPLTPIQEVRPDIPDQVAQIISHMLEKDPAKRLQTAAQAAQQISDALARMSGFVPVEEIHAVSRRRWIALAAAIVLIAAAIGVWLYRRAADRLWARDHAPAQIDEFISGRRPLEAFGLLKKAEKILPSDPRLRQIADANTQRVTIESEPSGAEVELKDYLTPDAAWYKLGTTPLQNVRIPKGYFRWRVAKSGVGEVIGAPENDGEMHFSIAAAKGAPAGMVLAPGGYWTTYASFLGWIGPYTLPAFYVDRTEVTNREYQKFVDSGGYAKPDYWPSEFHRDGHTLSWKDGMTLFRDITDRPGPSTWAGGHYPSGKADFPVSGVSWFEAAAYAKFAGKTLPVLAQWYKMAPPDEGEYVTQLSNYSGSGPAAVGSFQGIGPYGTYDAAGNVREWTANVVDNDLRFILGGFWKSPVYLYNNPEALSPFDRSDANGFRCVRNLGNLPDQAIAPFHRFVRDFATVKPVNDEVFSAYRLLYFYPNSPLNAKSEGTVKETEDWKEEKVSFDAAYNGERMSAYLFLPKRVHPPYQTVLFFPSARVEFLPPDSSNLGDIKFFDYILQSGRAVVYPIYQDTYERRLKYSLPGGSQSIALTTAWYKDAARTLDYLDTRPDFDKQKRAYLGVSMGSVQGVIISALMGDRLKTTILLDGGFFLDKPPAGGDEADFAPRIKTPVLMVNGRYDYTFPLDKAQNPLFEMLGTAPQNKSHVILETPHDVTEDRPQLVKTVLDWLDRYLGRVDE
jgi:hypothetical protein